MLINPTLINLKLKTVVKSGKKIYESVNEILQENEEKALVEINGKRLKMEEEVKENDKIIKGLEIEKGEVIKQIQNHEPDVKEQMKKVEMEKQKLQQLLSSKEEMEGQLESIEKSLKSLYEKQNQIANKSVKMYKDLKEITNKKKPQSNVINLENAEGIRILMHQLSIRLGNVEEVKKNIVSNEETVQYRFEYENNVYYFRISSNIEEELVIMHKQNNIDLIPPVFATGTEFFKVENKENEEEMNTVVEKALKMLTDLRNKLEKRRQ